jgi:hypothetical protein
MKDNSLGFEVFLWDVRALGGNARVVHFHPMVDDTLAPGLSQVIGATWPRFGGASFDQRTTATPPNWGMWWPCFVESDSGLKVTRISFSPGTNFTNASWNSARGIIK